MKRSSAKIFISPVRWATELTGKLISTASVDSKLVVVKDEKAFVTYECRMNDGKQLRNTELFTVREGKVVDVEVYFGWSLPHEAPVGKFVAAGTDGGPSTN